MQKLITILGPTATGKTLLAARLANLIQGEVISADSRQVYRGMDIGTGKDLEDYHVSGSLVPYHLVDIVDPGYEYNIFEFQNDFITVFTDVINRGKLPIFCGGSGLYLDSIIRNYKMSYAPENYVLRSELETLSDEDLVNRLKNYKELHNTTDTSIRDRTIRAIEIAEFHEQYGLLNQALENINSINFGISFERSEIRERITVRLKHRLSNGLIEEIKNLLEANLKPEQLIFYGLEYKFVTQYVTGELSFDEMFNKLNIAIHQFAKRQMTWFRRMEKKGVEIDWIDGNLPIEEKLEYILFKMKQAQ